MALISGSFGGINLEDIAAPACLGQGQVVLGFYRDGGHYLNFPLPLPVEPEGFLRVIQDAVLLLNIAKIR